MPKLRKLKPIEQKLLKKVDFLNWKTDGNENVRKAMLKTITKYHLRDQNEFYKYSKIAKQVNDTVREIRQLKGPEYDNFRREQVQLLSRKLYQMGVLNSEVELDDSMPFKPISVGRFCRRRLSYIMKEKNFAEGLKLAEMYISHGHVRIGPEVVTDPAFIVTRNLEDFVTWSYGSKIRRTIQQYNNQEDDFELMNC